MRNWGFSRSALRALATLALSLLLAQAARAADDFLDPDQAFRVSAQALDAHRIEVRFDIAPGYYLYRERFNAELAPSSVAMAELRIPAGKRKYDETLQKEVEIYRDSATLVVVLRDAATAPFKLSVGNQGCADKGLCYSPQKRAFQVEPGQAAGAGMRLSTLTEAQAQAWAPNKPLNPARPSAAAALLAATAMPAATNEDAGQVSHALKSGKPLFVIGLFLLFGLGLAFTPCVLPMMPILSSIIVGQGGQVSKARGFSLALVYSLGMALVYTAFGIASALAGEGLGAALQNAWVLGGFALLLALLSLSMFGVFELQVPASLQARLVQASQGLKGGQHLGVFVMGGISALIVGPCVAAPLAGALVYISQTRDVLLGGTALFSLAVGMSLPLLLLGLSAGALLPRAGAWMLQVKHGFGVALLAVALWMVSPVLPVLAVMLLSAALLLLAAVYLGILQGGPRSVSPARRVANGLGLLLCVLALAELAGAATGGRDLWRPLAHWRAQPATREAAASRLKFQPVQSLAELDAAVRASPRPVMLDLYADWCVSCKELEALTFSDPAVSQRMAGFTLLRADVTANNDNDRALLRRYTLFGPPALLFFAPAGDELASLRVIGYQNAEQFRAQLDRVDAATSAHLSLK